MSDDASAPTLPGIARGRYNTIFGRLVNHNDDLPRLIAYSLYKIGKRDWIIRFRQQYDRPPDEREVAAYHDHFSDDDLQRLRKQAEEMMIGFAEVIVADRAPQIREDAITTTMVNQQADILRKLAAQGSVWTNVKANIIAGLIMTGLVVVLLLSVYLVPGLDDVASKIVKAIKGVPQPQ